MFVLHIRIKSHFRFMCKRCSTERQMHLLFHSGCVLHLRKSEMGSFCDLVCVCMYAISLAILLALGCVSTFNMYYVVTSSVCAKFFLLPVEVGTCSLHSTIIYVLRCNITRITV